MNYGQSKFKFIITWHDGIGILNVKIPSSLNENESRKGKLKKVSCPVG